MNQDTQINLILSLIPKELKDLIGEIYSKKIPYLRDKNQYEGSAYISLKNDREFIFNEINKFSSDNKLNISFKEP